MNKDYSQLFAQFILSMSDQLNMPDERKKEIIRNQLSRELAQYINNNMGELPINYNKVIDRSTGSESYTIRINLISDEELRRLRDIESQFYYPNKKEQWNE